MRVRTATDVVEAELLSSRWRDGKMTRAAHVAAWRSWGPDHSGAVSVRARQLRRPQGGYFVLMGQFANIWHILSITYTWETLKLLLRVTQLKCVHRDVSKVQILCTCCKAKYFRKEHKNSLNLSFHIITFMGRMAQYCTSYEGNAKRFQSYLIMV